MATKFEVINVDFDDLFEPVRAGFNSVEFDRKYLAPQNMTGPMKYMARTGDATNPNTDYYYYEKESKTWKLFDAHPKGYEVPKKLEVSGEWSNTQWSNIEPDITGLTLTVTWQDGTTDDVTSSVVVKVGSSTKWGSASGSTQTATFTYIHHGITVTTTKDAVPIRKLISFACTKQTWSNYQFYGDAPTTDGLEFTATYSNGTTAVITPDFKGPSTWATGTAAQTSTVQNATFGYAQDGVAAADITVGATVYRKVTTLEVSGSWSNTQWTNIAPDITGLVFKATFNNGATIDPVAHTSIIVRPNTWNGTVGEQEATFTFTERGATAECTKKADVKRKLSSLSFTGDWDDEHQFYGETPYTYGLTFTANYNNGTSETVTPTVKVGTGTTWAVGSVSEASNTQTATFSYSENDVTVSNTKDATVYRMLTSFAKTGGSWGYQYYDTAVNYSGLVFTAYYNNNSNATITPDLNSSSEWGSSSEDYNTQTATFSYSERDVPVREVDVNATVYKKLTGFTTGSFSAYQYYNEAVNVTGMQFRARYNNGSQDSGYISDYSSMISVSSPDKWAATGSQTATFTCSKYGISLNYNVNATVYRVVTSLRFTGEWSNTQWTNVQADITGLKFYADFNNGDINIEVTPTSISTWNGTVGNQTATFTYTEHGRSASTTKNATVYRRLDSLTVGGSWSNYQFYGEAPDTTGLTFTANYNNGTTASVTPSKSVSTWASYSTESHDQDITFSYSERGVSAAGVTKSVTVYRKPDRLEVSGDWSNIQYYGYAPDITGLTFKVYFNNDSSSIVTPSVSPSIWQGIGPQTATFSYNYYGRTVSVSKNADVFVDIILNTFQTDSIITSINFT